jgi:hypothetical protein
MIMLGKHVRTRKGLALAYFKKPPWQYPGESEEEQVAQGNSSVCLVAKINSMRNATVSLGNCWFFNRMSSHEECVITSNLITLSV